MSFVKIYPDEVFRHAVEDRKRIYYSKLKRICLGLNVLANFFCNVVIKNWNNPLSEVLGSECISAFEPSLDELHSVPGTAGYRMQ